MKLKVKLTEDVKARLIVSEGLMGMLADRVKTTHYTIKRQVLSDSPTLCLPHYIKEIKDILSISEDTEITETYPINQPHEIIA
jgi:hypothetical protein